MVSPVWLARIAGAAALVSTVLGCEQPTGVVLSVQGVESTEQIYLTVGDSASMHRSDQPRFVQGAHTGPIDYAAPFPSDFEIFIESPDLLSKSQLALVLDSVSGPATSPEILRDSFEVRPESGTLLEVRLKPAAIGPGQWVCAGRPRTPADPGVVIELDGRDTDCDRDGWDYGGDPDDADPLQTGTPAWVAEGPVCRIKIGNRPLRDDPSCLGACGIDLLEDCLGNRPQVRCEVNGGSGSFSVAELMPVLPSIPNWELVKLGPKGASAIFEPSMRSPNEWRVRFDLGAQNDKQMAWFLLRDRSTADEARLIRVELNDDGGEAKCTDTP